MPSQLDHYLRGEQSEGCWDSEGAFTVSLEQALGKTARYSLERPSAWVLKVVQAAVGMEATTFNVRVRKQVATLTIGLKEGGPSWRQLREAILWPERETSPALRDLAAGLLFLAQTSERTFWVDAVTGPEPFERKYPALRWQLGEFRFNNKDADQEACRELNIVICRPPAHLLTRIAWLFGGGTHFLDECDELRRTAYLQPLDGDIDDVNAHHFLRAQAGVVDVARGLGFKSYPNPFLWGWCSSPELPELNLHSRWEEFALHVMRGGDYTPAQKWLVLEPRVERPGALWALSFDLASRGERPARESSQIRWVRDGVVVDTTSFPLPQESSLGVVLHLCAAGLPTDLGGMRLREGVPLEERRSAGLRAFRGHLKPERMGYFMNYWKLPEGALEACLRQVGLLGEYLDRHL